MMSLERITTSGEYLLRHFDGGSWIVLFIGSLGEIDAFIQREKSGKLKEHCADKAA